MLRKQLFLHFFDHSHETFLDFSFQVVIFRRYILIVVFLYEFSHIRIVLTTGKECQNCFCYLLFWGGERELTTQFNPYYHLRKPQHSVGILVFSSAPDGVIGAVLFEVFYGENFLINKGFVFLDDLDDCSVRL